MASTKYIYRAMKYEVSYHEYIYVRGDKQRNEGNQQDNNSRSIPIDK